MHVNSVVSSSAILYKQLSHAKQIPANSSTLEVREMQLEAEAEVEAASAEVPTASVLLTATAIAQVITAGLTHLVETVIKNHRPSA